LEKARILIVDDQMQLREFLRITLKDRYTVATAGGAEEAFKYLSIYPVNLVLLDFRMPKMDGVTALEEIKKKHPETEVIMLTAYASRETIQRALKLGAFAFLMKPFDIDTLIKTIDEALKKRGSGRLNSTTGII
jgi:DNA-binding NtrC family response regulator